MATRKTAVQRVLVLDDDVDLREALAQLIELYGHRCIAAAGMGDVLRQRDAVLNCDVAIIDINLGDGVPSGLDAYRWLLGEHFPGTILFLTGHARSHPLVASACRTGAAVLEKPIDVDDVRGVLRAPSR
jgi:DNA-binding NtrC family response regulator